MLFFQSFLFPSTQNYSASSCSDQFFPLPTTQYFSFSAVTSSTAVSLSLLIFFPLHSTLFSSSSHRNDTHRIRRRVAAVVDCRQHRFDGASLHFCKNFRAGDLHHGKTPARIALD
eukprot:TRINITY_DN3945_c0_g1_i3.p1 TRINITY_DN3945_c0_g1~~TRINITY_DN3945_c0_g1_i3.p1  ORF type:complete len:115 (-),score=12.70 TRINITY_DN3945_c0_g1_i3:198-542(-)